MKIWTAITKKIVNNGAVVKDSSGIGEVLLGWNLREIIKVDINTWSIATSDGPWASKNHPLAKEGVYVAFTTDDDNVTTFPTDKTKVTAAAFAAKIERIGFPQQDGGFDRPAAVIVWHDFRGDRKKGDSGRAFAEAVRDHFAQQFHIQVHLVAADGNYPSTISKLEALSNHKNIDRLIIVTHGTPGQLWLGNADGESCRDVVGFPTAQKPFVPPQEFGAVLHAFFGDGLNIVVCACDAASSSGNAWMTMYELCNAARAKALYAAPGTVHLHANKAGKSSATSTDGPVWCFQTGQDPVVLSRQDATSLPLFVL